MRTTQAPLDTEEMSFWKSNSYLHLKGFLSPREIILLKDWTEELAALPETTGKWTKYFEYNGPGGQGRQLSRIENFVPYHGGFADFMNSPHLLAVLSQLMGEQPVLFKDKINFKPSGGKGFKGHQDAPAFTTFKQPYHITVLVSVDSATVENGCLEVVPGYRASTETLQQAPDGSMRQDVIDSFEWKPLPTEPGDLILFDSYLPHGSAPNRSSEPRRVVYVTYNPISAGDRREEYFADKRRCFPPEHERGSGVDYSKTAGVYNLGNKFD